MTYDKVTNSEVGVQKLTYEKLMTHLGYRNPQKALPYPERRVLTYFA